MKTYKNLYPQICDFANLYTAYRRARLAMKSRGDRAAPDESGWPCFVRSKPHPETIES